MVVRLTNTLSRVQHHGFLFSTTVVLVFSTTPVAIAPPLLI